ncbi:MAG: putative abductin-like protein [Myxococcaceae bacterium]|nr:putative abductin-like protein [Myxococcaceae bacterium]
MRAMNARAESCALDVEVRWGSGELLGSEHLRGVAGYTLHGDALPVDQAGFVVQRDWLGADSLTLANVRDGEVHVQHVSGAPQTLQLGEQTLVHVGPLVFRVAAVEPRVRTAANTWRDALTPRDQAWTLVSLLVHGIALACLTWMPPKAAGLSLELMSEDTRYARYLTTPVEPEELPWTPEVPTEKASSVEAARAKEDEGAAGKQDAPQRDRRMAVQGKSDTRVVAKQTAIEQARTAGILGALSTASLQLGPSSEFGAHSPLGYDPVAAIGKLFGQAVGDDFGVGALGMNKAGRGGGGDASGTVAVGNLGTGDAARGALAAHGSFLGRREPHVPVLRGGTPEVRGSLSKETIRRAIRLHLNEVRFCYESGLARDPQLAGRLSVSFLIAPSGAVQQAVVKESTLLSQSVSDCVAQAVRRFSFPAPDGGGYVQVTYPFSFAADGAGE